jgi:hypothetical protein
VCAVQCLDNTLTVTVKDKENDLLALNRILMDGSIPYHAIGILEPSLENVYLTLTHEERKEA